jgi:hypothetical protein
MSALAIGGVLGGFWVIASFPAAAVIGRRLTRREQSAPWWPWAEPESCGCRWWARPAPGAEPEPVWRPCDKHADRLLRLVNGEAEMCAHCPDCGEEMQDEAFEFWCPRCEAAVSYARAASEGA